MANDTDCRRRTDCRLCSSSRLELAVPYPATPVADDYAADGSAGADSYPLDLYLCTDCGHVQLCNVVDPEILFRNYSYETSISLGLVEHFRRYAADVAPLVGPVAGRRVVEIGSNDGSLLRSFRELGFGVLGVDPAREIARKATAAGIETLPEFFSASLAQEIRKRYGAAAIVAANNVFAHADDLADMAEGVAILLDREGLFTFEVSYLPDIIEQRLFDTIYHEHLCYHSVKPLLSFLRRHGLELVDFIRIPTKGGSFRGIAKRAGGSRPVAPVIAKQLEYEAGRGYDRLDVYRRFSAELQRLKAELLDTIAGLKAAGKRVAGYGASATVTTLMYYFDLGKELEFLVDDNPRKHHTFSPGCRLPVLPSQALYERRPNYVVILAWNYADPIVKKHATFLQEGGRFIVPVPTVRLNE